MSADLSVAERLGSEGLRLRELARGTTTTMLGYVDDAAMNALMGNARAAILNVLSRIMARVEWLVVPARVC